MITISKLVITAFSIIYMVMTYGLSFHIKLKDKKILHTINYLNIAVIHITAFIIMYKNTGRRFFILFGITSVCIQLCYRAAMSFIYKKHNRLLANNMCFFYTTGIVIIARLSQEKAVKQLIFLTLAFILSLIIPAIIRYFKLLHKMNLLFAFLSIGVLFILYIKGNAVNGAIITFQIGSYAFQPTEFIKVIIIFFIASLLAAKINTLRLCYSGIIVMICTGFLVISKDLGSAAIFLIIYFSMLYKSTGKLRVLTIGFVLAVGGCVLAFMLFAHLRTRINIWINPWNDIEGSGYQIVQSLFSIGMGGFFGSGIMEGMPGLIPFVESDMIFSAVIEEMGSIYGAVLILIYLNCFLELISVSNKISDKFYSYLSYGIGVCLIFQAFLTIGGSIKYIPLTGVTLPFISYGGSSALATGILFGIAHGLNMIMHNEAPLKAETEDNAETETYEEDYKSSEGIEIYEDYNISDEIDFYEEDGRKHSLLIKICFSALYIGMILYIFSFQLFESDKVITNEYNVGRIEKLSKHYIRGDILSRDNEILARTLDNTEAQPRVYPYGEVFAHTIGNLYNGKSGVEAIANLNLSYKKISIMEDIKNTFNHTKTKADNVITTLDYTLQMAAYNALADYKGAIIVMSPKSGEILAMVSSPSYDPNDISTVYSMLKDNQLDSVFLNRATSGLYTPGSTFKIFTALEYIRQNKNTFNSFDFDCNGTYRYENYELQCYHKKAHGEEDLEEAFANSCNCAFAHIGQHLDKDKFKRTLSDLFFMKNIPCPLPAGKSHVSVGNDTSEQQMVQISIGQSNTVITPMHLALITCAIANDGILTEPTILINSNKSPKHFTLLTQEEADTLSQMMQSVVSYGTAASINPLYMAAGKTGSAEFTSDSDDTHAWFTGFAPYDDPEIVVTVILEGAGTGSKHAVPIAEMIIDTYFSNM